MKKGIHIVMPIIVALIIVLVIAVGLVMLIKYSQKDYAKLLPSRTQGAVCPFESCKELWEKKKDGHYCWGIDKSEEGLEEDTLIHVEERDIKTLISARLKNNYKPVFCREIHVSPGITIIKVIWIPPEE